MSILIEQTQAEMQASHAVSRRVEIIGLKITSAAFSAPKTIPLELEDALSVGVRCNPDGAVIKDGCIRATTNYECVITESTESEDSDPVARFACSLLAVYQLHDDYVPSDSELEAFHKANVVFNGWPFFREFIQNAACRMNIPPPPIPFIRVQISSEPTVNTTSIPKKGKARNSPKQVRSKRQATSTPRG